MTDPGRPHSRVLIGLGLLLWVGLVGAGFFWLHQYSSTPGASADAPSTWPELWALDSEQHTLVMVLHPQCSCSRASVAELARLERRVAGSAAIHVVFALPEGAPSDWSETDLWASAERIPGATLHPDVGGTAAEMLGARTSGQTYLYGADGKLRFSGGLTPSRSHQGDSVGRQQLLAALFDDLDEGRSAVYGCEVSQ